MWQSPGPRARWLAGKAAALLLGCSAALASQAGAHGESHAGGRCAQIGPITLEDVPRLADAFAQGCKRMILNSVGGDVEAAIEIGRKVRASEASVTVLAGGKCTSACVFIYAGGVQRFRDGVIEIHRPFLARAVLESVAATRARYRHMERLVKPFLNEMGVSESLYDRMMAVRPEFSRRLSDEELESLGLGFSDYAYQENVDNRNALRLGLDRQAFMAQKSAAVRACGQLEGLSFNAEQVALLEACWRRTFPGFLR